MVESLKFLGLIIDNKLSWKPHTVFISKLLSRNVGIINKLRWMFPVKVLLLLYLTLMLPYLNYGILAWGNSCKHQLEKLLIIQKRAMRIICNSPRLAPSSLLFFKNKVLKVADLYHLRLGCLMFQANLQELPQALISMFTKNYGIHNYTTRQSSLFHLPRPRTNFTQKTLIYTGPIYWNLLDLNLKHSPSFHSFKRNLKFHLLNIYNVS